MKPEAYVVSSANFFMDKLRCIAVEISQRLFASSLQAVRPCTGHISTFTSAARFRTSLHGRGCEANQATAAEIDANGLPIPTFILKTTVNVMAPALARLANLSFSTGVFPSRYKLGHVTRLLKKPGLCSTDPANYRLVTNLATFSKILEKLALNRVRPHVLSSSRLNMYTSRSADRVTLLKQRYLRW